MIDDIAPLHSPTGALVSVYVNRRPPATRTEMVDVLKPLRDVERERAALKSIRSDTERLAEMATRIDAGSHPAAALFASEADGVFEYRALSHPVEPVATVGPRPHLRPLRARPAGVRVGVLLGETGRARTYLGTDGDLAEIGDELSAEVGKDNYGGFGGYEEHRIRSRAAEVSARVWKEAGRRLLEAHQEQPLELVVVAGHEESLESIAEQLHPYLHVPTHGRITVDPHGLTTSDLGRLIEDEVTAQRRRRDEALLERLLGEVGRGGNALAGLSEVLAAANARAVEQLVVAGPYAKPGVLCDPCRWLGRSGDACPLCGGPVFEVDDVVSAAMDAVADAGGAVAIVDVASRLDAEGVGALLRFPVPAS